jgi:hypothetical protein
MSTPKALRLADECGTGYPLAEDAMKAAAELRRQHAEIESMCTQLAATHGQINSFYLGTPETRLLAALAERDALRKDAARWQHVWQCVRIGQHGEYALMPDDPTGLMEDSIARSSFLRDVDAAMSGGNP